MFFKLVLVWKNIGHLVFHWKKAGDFSASKGVANDPSKAIQPASGWYTPWWHLFSDLSIWEALFSKVDHADQIAKGYSPPFVFLCPEGFFVEKNHWPGNSIRTRKRCEEFSHRPETPCRTCVFLGDGKPWLGVTRSVKSTFLSTWKHLQKNLRSLLPIFQTKIATTQTMTASKWRKEAYVIFFCGCATVIIPDFCVDETTIVFKLQIEALGEIWGKPKVQLFHH